MRRNRNYSNKKFSTIHLEDPLKDWLSGKNRRKRAISDAMQLSNEVLNRRHELFPIKSVPVSNKPGYVTYDRNFFRVITKGKRISKDMTYYFTDEHYPRDEKIVYGHAHELGEFFNSVFNGLLIEGVAHYAVEWNDVLVNGKKYLLPTDILWVNPSTVVLPKQKGGVVKQKHSWVAKAINDYEYQDYSFEEGEFVFFKHPDLYPKSPVKNSMKLLDDLRQWWRFGLWQGKANNDRENHSLPLERTRYSVSSKYQRKQDITRALVKNIFSEPVSGVIPITEFYEIYTYKESKKNLNRIREYVVQVFNEQILSYIKEKNDIKSEIKLEYRGFVSNEEIDEWFSWYAKQKISWNEFIEAIKDNYDTKLF